MFKTHLGLPKSNSARAGYLAAFVVVAVLAAYAVESGLTRSTGAYAQTSYPPRSSAKGPVRLARFVLVKGNVSWRPTSQAGWSAAKTNLPIRQGAEISVAPTARTEVQFDDGTRLDLGRGALASLKSMYSDSQGEFTEITLQDGSAALRLMHDRTVYQVDAPYVSVDSTGPSRFRVDAENGVQVAVRQGRCTLDGDQGRKVLVAGESISLHSAQDPYEVASLPSHDSFDDWLAARYSDENRALNSPDREYLPRNAAIAADNLDDYGTWTDDPRYGEVWRPHVRRAHWRPYHYGHWVWVDPFGWTWVSDEPWGWVPYHYGTWAYEPYGWVWVPGPVVQYWSPATVSFFIGDDDEIVWAPWAPSEVIYPSALSIGFRSGDWSFFFSIGGAAAYYPTFGGFVYPRPWATTVVNNFTTINNSFGTQVWTGNTFVAGNTVMPLNARVAPGATAATFQTFAGTGSFTALAANPRTTFARGRQLGAPLRGGTLVSGPAAVPATLSARTATRTLAAGDPVARTSGSRQVFQGGSRVRTFSDARQLATSARPFSRSSSLAMGGSRILGSTSSRSGGAMPVQRSAALARQNVGMRFPSGGSLAGSATRGAIGGAGRSSRSATAMGQHGQGVAMSQGSQRHISMNQARQNVGAQRNAAMGRAGQAAGSQRHAAMHQASQNVGSQRHSGMTQGSRSTGSQRHAAMHQANQNFGSQRHGGMSQGSRSTGSQRHAAIARIGRSPASTSGPSQNGRHSSNRGSASGSLHRSVMDGGRGNSSQRTGGYAHAGGSGRSGGSSSMGGHESRGGMTRSSPPSGHSQSSGKTSGRGGGSDRASQGGRNRG